MKSEEAVVFPWHARDEPLRRDISPAEWARLEAHVAEILTVLGMDLDTPGTAETPQRFLRALYDATAGYDGDPKLLTSFPAEHRRESADRPGQIVEGPIAFFALCEHHALPFHGMSPTSQTPRSSASPS